MANTEKKLTPLMQQYWDIKSEHMNKILLFRMGDFFEMFHDDAVTAAPILNIALTTRNKKSKDDTPMCGMPHHSIAGPIAKLLQAGYKVAICDQVEDPKLAKGIVKRAVTRILSPGMVYDPDTLDQLSANYLCSYDSETLSFLETTTGEAFYFQVTLPSERQKLMALLSPSEIVLSNAMKAKLMKEQGLQGMHVTEHEDVISGYETLPQSAQRLLSYAVYMQGEDVLKTLAPFVLRQSKQCMELAPTVVRHLELFETYKGDKKGSLFFALNRTKTSSGARLLKSWMQFPLLNLEQISERQSQVEFWFKNHGKMQDVRKILSGMGDIERRLAKVASANCHVHDLLSLSQSLRAGLNVSPFCSGIDSEALKVAEKITATIENMLVDEPPVAIKNGGFIRKGLRPDLDELIRLAEESQSLLAEMELAEKEKTGITSLKIRYNNVFGYYIEVTNTHKDKVPDHYKRKQTLTNAERYLTQELQELEDKILSAKSKRVELEQAIFHSVRMEISKAHVELLNLAHSWSELDVFCSLAWVAIEYNYKKPSFNKERNLQLKSSRHPVVEQEVGVPFVPNDVVLNPSECLLLTGPNMAGKSTIMRQVAVISIMAQMGSFVPVSEASLPLFDRVFTRIGASDFLSEGLSTFMVEMKESAEMLKESTENSLVVLDEVGRGTSTYDGMSLAQSILEYLVVKKKCTTLFATHYHEITALDRKFPQVKNAHMSISEKSGEIRFLHSLVSGAANKSYGIQVAQLAGMPRSVIGRASKILEGLETGIPSDGQMTLMDGASSMDQIFVEESSPADEGYEQFKNELRDLPLQQMTPLDALNIIAKWQQDLI